MILILLYDCRQTRELGGSPHSSSPTESGRRGRSQYASSPLLGERKRSPAHPVIEEIKKMPASIGISKNGLLAQQIHEEFLCCKICLDSFTNPKSLNCLHTFCEECIENHANSESSYKKYSDYREFTCPLCRKRTSLPLGGVRKLPDNFLVSSLTEVIDRQKPSKFPLCDMCKLVSRKHSEASSKCLDCNKTLCKDCVDQHLSTKVGWDPKVFWVSKQRPNVTGLRYLRIWAISYVLSSQQYIFCFCNLINTNNMLYGVKAEFSHLFTNFPVLHRGQK